MATIVIAIWLSILTIALLLRERKDRKVPKTISDFNAALDQQTAAVATLVTTTKAVQDAAQTAMHGDLDYTPQTTTLTTNNAAISGAITVLQGLITPPAGAVTGTTDTTGTDTTPTPTDATPPAASDPTTGTTDAMATDATPADQSGAIPPATA